MRSISTGGCMSRLEPTHRIRVLTIFGTRPEAIKLAPVCHALTARTAQFESRIAVTAQHRGLLDSVLRDFELSPGYDLNIMRDNQDLFHITAQAIIGLREALDDFKPHYVLVQGDTTTTFVGALAAFYRKISVGHVEAGLRTHQKYSPYPEEINRRLTGCIADLHFAPTDRARTNLRAEGVDDGQIMVTGNTGIDALLWILKSKASRLEESLPPAAFQATRGRFILLTTHRRESFGEPLARTLAAVRELAERFAEVAVIFPVHPNPNVREAARARLGGIPNVHLVEPVDYIPFCQLMNRAEIVLTDSGGIQEEAPSLNKPVLVLRETTERPEGIDAGVARLVGTDRERIVAEATRLLTDRAYVASMTGKPNPYGDGRAAERIVEAIARRFAAQVPA